MLRVLLILFIVSTCLDAQPDWPQAKAEALETLVALVKLDTSQPEGNEIRAARYLKSKLDAEGIASEIVEQSPPFLSPTHPASRCDHRSDDECHNYLHPPVCWRHHNLVG